VASRKVEKLLPFSPRIKVISPKATAYIEELATLGRLELVRRKLKLKGLLGAFMVIVAVDDVKLQERVYRYCLKKGIHCNAVDSPDFCTFPFPALIVRYELVIGISTSGIAPALSAGLREYIQRCIPENVEELLRELESIRERIPKGEKRQKRLMYLVKGKLFKDPHL
jgi:precorrin-2 dehydrogenase/sirohydrochlorin ferrochelatase